MHFKKLSITMTTLPHQRPLSLALIAHAVWLSFLNCTPAFAWGERGHGLVTQVAARLFVARGGIGASSPDPILKPFRDKELMLSHLSNVPDIVWRSLPREQTESLNPTHWINLEYLGFKDSRSVVPLGLSEALSLVRQNCRTSRLEALIPCDQDLPSPSPSPSLSKSADSSNPSRSHATKSAAIFGEVGSAPWRIEQLAGQMESALRGVTNPSATSKNNRSTERRGKKARSGGMGKAAEAQVNDALVAAGLLSHFVADLGQPFHATRNYDGFETGQGGIHSYYETQVIGELDLGLIGRVYDLAKTLSLDSLPEASRIAGRAPRDLAFILAAHSYGQIQVVEALDKKHAIIEPSIMRAGLKIPAKRKPAQEVAMEFGAVVAEHLAWSAVILSEIYWRTWIAAGRPDLSQYASYFYAVSASPVPPTYLTIEN
jgi:hypothetical protein